MDNVFQLQNRETWEEREIALELKSHRRTKDL